MKEFEAMQALYIEIYYIYAWYKGEGLSAQVAFHI